MKFKIFKIAALLLIVLSADLLKARELDGELLVFPTNWRIFDGACSTKIAVFWQITNCSEGERFIRTRELGKIVIVRKTGESLTINNNPQDHQKPIESSDYLLIRPAQTINLPFTLVIDKDEKTRTASIKFLYNSNELAGYTVKSITPGEYSIRAVYDTSKFEVESREKKLFEAFEKKQMSKFINSFWIGEIKSKPVGFTIR